MYDLRLKRDFRFLIVAPSQAGKTVFTKRLLEAKEQLFEVKSAYTVYFYNLYQPIFDEMKACVDEFRQGVPSLADIEEISKPYIHNGGVTIVLDDFAQHVTKDIAELFSVGSHHNHVSIFWLCQNLYGRNKFQRDLSLNATYIAFFKSPRDNTTIKTFARQCSFYDNSQYIVDAYRTVTSRPYGYLFFDFHQKTPDALRIRSDILPHEAPMKVWIPKNCTI